MTEGGEKNREIPLSDDQLEIARVLAVFLTLMMGKKADLQVGTTIPLKIAALADKWDCPNVCQALSYQLRDVINNDEVDEPAVTHKLGLMIGACFGDWELLSAAINSDRIQHQSCQ